MSQVTAEHRDTSPEGVRCAVVTVSDTRTPATDTGGQLLCDLLAATGFEILRAKSFPTIRRGCGRCWKSFATTIALTRCY